MKAKELIEILRQRPEAEIVVISQNSSREIDRVVHMAYTTFIHADSSIFDKANPNE
jgi:hypothetical protein